MDYLSGDYSMMNSYNEARYEARALAPQGMTWDLMAWSFAGHMADGVRSTKSVEQLKQEAAAVLAMGGGFQAYFTQKRDGSIKQWEMKLMGEVADFCRERKEWCHKSKQLPDIALYNGSYNFYRGTERVFASWNGESTATKGVLNCLLDNQYSVETLYDHHLEGRFGDYPVIVVPEHRYMLESFKEKALEYVNNGGSLLLIGPLAAQNFENETGVRFLQKADEAVLKDYAERRMTVKKPGVPSIGEPVDYHYNIFVESGKWLAGYSTLAIETEPLEGTKVIAKAYTENDNISKGFPAATVVPYGKGNIGVIWFDMGADYNHAVKSVTRELVGSMLKELYPERRVSVEGSHTVDVVLGEKNGETLVHLINTSGPHSDDSILIFDEIPAVGPLTVKLRLDVAPKAVISEPGGKKLEASYQDGVLSFTVDELAVYDIVRILR